MKRAWLALAACIALALTSGGVTSATVAAGTGRAVTAAEQFPDGDGPPGFWWGTDSLPVTVPGSAPYSMPHLGGAYGGYIGAVDRADFNGFAAYIAAHSSYKVGVYSSPGVWTSIFGTGTDSLIPDTYEWTYEPETASLSNAPYGWCLRSGGCAQFFGGQTSSSPHALMWQWSGGGGIRNGVGDFDQIDAARQG